MENVFLTSLTLPEIKQLFRDELKTFFDSLKPQTKVSAETDHWFDLTELCSYLPDKPAKPTVYGWINSDSIPHHKGRKKLRFLKSEIDAWLKQGKRKTLSEVDSDTDSFLQNQKLN